MCGADQGIEKILARGGKWVCWEHQWASSPSSRASAVSEVCRTAEPSWEGSAERMARALSEDPRLDRPPPLTDGPLPSGDKRTRRAVDYTLRQSHPACRSWLCIEGRFGPTDSKACFRGGWRVGVKDHVSEPEHAIKSASDSRGPKAKGNLRKMSTMP